MVGRSQWSEVKAVDLPKTPLINDRLVITKVDLKIQCSPESYMELLAAYSKALWTIESSIML